MKWHSAGRSRRLLGSLVTVGGILASALAFATPAQASSYIGTFVYRGGVGTGTLTGAVGDTFGIDTNSASYKLQAGTGGVTKGGVACTALAPCSLGLGLTSSLVITGLGTFELTDSLGNVIATYTITAPSASSASSDPGPAPVIQQFGKPASGTCDAAAPASLNWSNVSSGSWGESWAEWMHGGTGGAVCTRMLVYSNNLGAWTVG